MIYFFFFFKFSRDCLLVLNVKGNPIDRDPRCNFEFLADFFNNL
jgi:hypothetical protein